MYYPIESFQSRFLPSPKVWTDAERDNRESFQASKTQEQVIRSLYRHGCDFSWLDGDAVLARGNPCRLLGDRGT